jgi:hypothetical protein
MLMKTIRGFAAIVACGLLLISAAPPTLAAPAEHLTIHITATGGTVWGRVLVRYNHVQRTCASASCTLTVPHGATVRLSQSATNAATWPFQQWTVQPTKAGMKPWNAKGSATTLKMKTSYAVTAVYVVASSGGYGYGH